MGSALRFDMGSALSLTWEVVEVDLGSVEVSVWLT